MVIYMLCRTRGFVSKLDLFLVGGREVRTRRELVTNRYDLRRHPRTRRISEKETCTKCGDRYRMNDAKMIE